MVPTLGDRGTLPRLLTSIQAQTLPPVEVVIVNQGRPELVEAARRQSSLNVSVVNSARGVSRARNVGLCALSAEWDVAAFADDDVWYEPAALERAADALWAPVDALSGTLFWVGSGRSRLSFPAQPTLINERNVWTASIESTLFLTRRFIEDVGELSETLGLGADSPWQSGEGTDLLLRGLKLGKTVCFDPTVVVWEENPAPTKTEDVLRRKRKYARGTGQVFARHYGVWQRSLLVAKSIARLFLGLRSGSLRQTRSDWAVLVGRIEGLRSRCFDR